MKKLKICVYAISKNETQFVDRWVDSVQEADEIYVLDTGSSDDTVEKLKKRGVHVTTETITPWRFDVARNRSLDLVPIDTDICVCIDLDEVLIPGWRVTLENLWTPDTTRMRYNYNWSFDEYGNPVVNFYTEKIHTRKNYHWTHPVHEVLNYTGVTPQQFLTTDEITVNHYPDATKSRSNYLPLLELSIAEDPDDDRNMHYLGREYMFHQRWNECIDTLIRHLNLPKATWKDERCASMRFIARSYKALNRYEEAKMWLEKAIVEAPYLRDPFMERALLSYQLEEWKSVTEYSLKALTIPTKQKSYINESFSRDEEIYDLLSIAYYYLKDASTSLLYVTKALKESPENERYQQNKKQIEALLPNI